MLICVDPTAYASAAETFGEHLASDVRSVAERLTGALSGVGAVAGHDPAGRAWAESYDAVAPQTVQAIDQLSRASVNVVRLAARHRHEHQDGGSCGEELSECIPLEESAEAIRRQDGCLH